MPEQVLIDHCSPTLAGLKTANMFPVSLDAGQDINDEVRKLNRMLHKKGIRIVVLRRTDRNTLLYVYRPEYLERDLEHPLARQILENRGYCCSSSGKCIAQLIRHMAEDGRFPHEVGLFLGYPPEDVRCFMEDSRRGVKCTGCWKAYGNEEEAQRTFRKYRKCTDVYRREFSKGRSLLQLTVGTGRLYGQDANKKIRKD